MAQTCDIAIIGGGASGLAAAVAAGRLTDGAQVKLLERCDRVGKKILATGNGRCNLTNTGAAPPHYRGNPGFIEAVLGRFGPERAMEFFEELGVRCRVEEEGRVYPASDQASSVLDVLRLECDRLRVAEVCGFEAASLRQNKDAWMVVAKDGAVLHARKVIVAAGGCASPALGSNGSGYALLTDLGHALAPVYPALTQIRTKTDDIRPLKGVRVYAGVAARLGGAPLAHTRGEVLFAEYGLSGIAVFDLSGATGAAFAQGRRDVEIVLDLAQDLAEAELTKLLFSRARILGMRPLEHFFTGMLHKRLGAVMLRVAGVPAENRACADLTAVEIRRLASALKGWTIPAVANMGFANAQVTAGGIATDGFDGDTLESKFAPGIYAAGEVLDVDGDCGGYNLQWAWASGYLAGEAAALSLAQ